MESRFEQLKSLVLTLRSRNVALADENNALRVEVERLRADIGGKLYQERGPMGDLVKSVEQLRDTLAKKMDDKTVRDLATGKPLRVMVAEVGVSSGSEKLAQELLEQGDMPLTPSKHSPRIEEL